MAAECLRRRRTGKFFLEKGVVVVKQSVAVLFGGRSTEHEVSCVSARAVLQNIDRDRFDVVMIGLSKNGDWLPYEGPLEAVPTGEWEALARAALGEAGREGCGMAGGVALLQSCDVIFPVLHGLNGEDGTVQGVFELLDKPYVGCNVLASAVCMDKVYTKIVLDHAGIPQCKHVVVLRHNLLADPEGTVDEVEARLGYPCFIKPSNSGSSVGVYKVRDREELRSSLLAAQRFDRKILVEEFVDGREIECAVLGNFEPKTARPGEIIPSKEFYDYEDKYQSGASVAMIPADLSEEQQETVRRLAVQAFLAVDCSGLARVDFFCRRDTGELLLNEINTLPGFTEISMYGKMWAADGLSFPDLLSRLIELAYQRREDNARWTE